MAGELILIVDDQEILLKQVQVVLEKQGYRTLTASSGPTALELLAEHGPDLLLSDIRMGDFDGLQLWGQAQQIRPTMPGVFMSAHGSINTVVKALNLGLSGFLLKPFGSHELIEVIESVFKRTRQQQETARVRLLTPFLTAHRKLKSIPDDLGQLCQGLIEALAQEIGLDYCTVFEADDPTSPRCLASFVGPTAPAKNFPAARLATRTLELGRSLNLRRATGQLPSAAEQDVPGVIAGLPLRIGGSVMGVLLVGRLAADRPFEPTDREIFEVLAVHLATLLQSHRLQTAFDGQEARLRSLLGRLVVEQEAEKQTLNAQFQSELLPNLTSTRKNVQAFLQRARPSSAGDLLQAEERLHNLINSVKRLTGRLQPTNLDEFGLSAALRQYVREMEDTPCQAVFRLEGEEVPRLEKTVELALFRACQDGLDYACQGAGQGQVGLTVRVIGPRNKPTLVEFEVSTDRPGLEPTRLEAEQPALWLKLAAIEERVRLAGGSYRLKSDQTGIQIVIGHTLPVLESA